MDAAIQRCLTSGDASRFERLLAKLHLEWWMGHGTEIRANRGLKQKHVARLPNSCCGSCRTMLSADLGAELENRDLRQLLCHRHPVVQMRQHD